MTTTRELLLGESPEVFHVKAFDDEGKTTPPPITREKTLAFGTFDNFMNPNFFHR